MDIFIQAHIQVFTSAGTPGVQPIFFFYNTTWFCSLPILNDDIDLKDVTLHTGIVVLHKIFFINPVSCFINVTHLK